MLFHKKIHLPHIDPLGDGLGDLIHAEELEPGAIVLEEYADGDYLAHQWGEVVEDVKREDPDWLAFANADE